MIVILLVLFTFHFSLFTSKAFALESTPSGGIAKKLEALKQEIASKAASLKKEIVGKLQNKAFVGVVKTKGDNSITLATKEGTKVVSTSQDTVFEDNSGKKQTGKKVVLSKETLQTEDTVAALGDVDDTGVLVARKIVLLPATPAKQKTILWGQISSMSDKTLTVRDKDSKSIAVSVTKDTELQKKGKEIAVKDLQDGNYVIVTGVLSDQDSTGKVGALEASFVYLLETANGPKPKESTSSASPSATVKASSKPATKPSVKPTASPTTR